MSSLVEARVRILIILAVGFLYPVGMIEEVRAIGFIEAIRPHAEDDFWGGEEACVVLTEQFTSEALQGITDFSHVEVLFLFDQKKKRKWTLEEVRHRCTSSRNNPVWPWRKHFRAAGKIRLIESGAPSAGA